MVTKEDIEGFLDRLGADGASYTEVEPGSGSSSPLASSISASSFTIRRPWSCSRQSHDASHERPKRWRRSSRRLLELNATDLVHGSYGIEDESIVMTEALELSHLDFEEFLAAYESITLALASHLRELGSFREAQ